MAAPKQRVLQHVMEDRSRAIVRETLPAEWVVRDYRPDYGIDLAVDLFEPVPGSPRRWIALGESFLVQVKAIETVRPSTLHLNARTNVERVPLRTGGSAAHEIQVARVRLDTSLLATVQAMGAAVPVLLFLVELSTRRIYFVCLNDLIDKVILLEDSQYAEKRSRTIHLPLRNLVEAGRPASVRPLSTYAKRAKLYAAFLKFGYQAHELSFALDGWDPDRPDEEARGREVLDLVSHFLQILLRYDFWTRMPEWKLIAAAHDELCALRALLRTRSVEADPALLRRYLLTAPHCWYDREFLEAVSPSGVLQITLTHIQMIWRRLGNLGGIFEERGREWFLPV